MRVIKVKMSTDFLKNVNLPDFLSTIKYLEVVEIYQYDRTNFFSLEKITFKPEAGKNIEETINKFFQPTLFQLLERTGNEVLCILKQRTDSGFWPMLLTGSWAIIPPICVDDQFIKTTLIIKDNVEKIFDQLASSIKTFEILAINEVQGVSDRNELQNVMSRAGQAYPRFSERQQEIATFAMRNGYYESPRRLEAKDLAIKFGISQSALNEHLRKAERTAMRYFFA